MSVGLTHLQRLEAEGIYIFREVVATSDHPVLPSTDGLGMLHD
jgi:hypothetical protein